MRLAAFLTLTFLGILTPGGCQTLRSPGGPEFLKRRVISPGTEFEREPMTPDGWDVTFFFLTAFCFIGAASIVAYTPDEKKPEIEFPDDKGVHP